LRCIQLKLKVCNLLPQLILLSAVAATGWIAIWATCAVAQLVPLAVSFAVPVPVPLALALSLEATLVLALLMTLVIHC
jgi:hypothetical protein